MKRKEWIKKGKDAKTELDASTAARIISMAAFLFKDAANIVTIAQINHEDGETPRIEQAQELKECNTCKGNNQTGPFHECVQVGTRMGTIAEGACMNCYYHGTGKKCSFRAGMLRMISTLSDHC